MTATGIGTKRSAHRLGLVILLLGALALLPARAATAGGDWNDAGVAWQSYDTGIAAAKKEKKPICLIFYTDWCPHCKNYSGIFHDPKVVELSKKLVMIRLNKDKNADLSAKYDLDGQYIPRTFFLSADGKVDPSIHAPRDRFKYFYDEMHPASVLAGMDEALKKLK